MQIFPVLGHFAGVKFDHFEEGLKRFVTDFAQKHGFVIGKITFKMHKDRAVQIFGKEEIILRGFLYCRNGGKSNCSFKVPFTYDFSISRYVINSESDGLCVDHNHFVMRSAIDGVKQKQFEEELTTEELDYIMEIGGFVPICKLRRILRWRCLILIMKLVYGIEYATWVNKKPLEAMLMQSILS